MPALTMMKIEDCVDRPFRVLRMSLSGALKLGRVIYVRTADGRVAKQGFVSIEKEGSGVAVDDSTYGFPEPGSLVVPVDEAP